MPKIESVNPDRIKWCCVDRGITIAELARAVGLAPAKLEAVVNREGSLSLGNLEHIAEFFGRGVLFFLDPDPVESRLVHTPQFRTLANQKATLTPKVLAIIERVERQREVFIGLREELGYAVDDFVAPETEEGKSYAQAVRAWLNVGDHNNFSSFREAIEARGILVFRTNGYAGEWQIDKGSPICGFSIRRTKLPVIVVRKEAFEPRQTFTLLHELGHLLLHKRSVVDDSSDLESETGVEREANAFAGAVLVPPRLLKQIDDKARPAEPREYRKWLGWYSRQWGASVEVILRRLLDADRLPESAYKGYRQWAEEQEPLEEKGGTRQYRHREPTHLFGQGYVRTVLDAMNARQITLAKATTYLDNIKLKDVHRLESFVANV